MSFDPELMAQTSNKIIKRQRQDLQSMMETHGADFTASVMSNVAVDLLAGVLSSASDDDARANILFEVLSSLAQKTMSNMSGIEAQLLMNRLRKGAK